MIDMLAFDKANPEIGILSDMPNLARLDAYLDRLVEWSYQKKFAEETVRREMVRRREQKAAQIRRTQAPRKRARAFRQKQIVNE